jgi:hypothetical protein
LHVLGLVFNVIGSIALQRASRRTIQAFQPRYPINFVVKYPELLLSPKQPSPGALETCRIESGLFPDRRHIYGSDPETANEGWWS